MERVGTVIFRTCIIVYRAGRLYQRWHIVSSDTCQTTSGQDVTAKVEEQKWERVQNPYHFQK